MKFVQLLLTLFLYLPLCAAQSVTVNVNIANLRGTASTSGKVVQKLSKGTRLEVIKESDPWYLAQSMDFVGWIHKSTVSISDPDKVVLISAPYVPSAGSPEVKSGGIRIGMSRIELEAIRGKPDNVSRTTTAEGVWEQLSYYGRFTTYFFFNGKLARISEN